MHTETISGLHKCQPKNAPEAGTIKNMVVLNMPAKNGKKAWIKIKSEKPEKGGSPYRLLNVEPLDWPPDDYGNIAFNIEVEATTAQPTAFANARATMQQGDEHVPPFKPDSEDRSEYRENALQSPPHAQQGARRETGIPGFAKREYTNEHTQQGEDGVMATRKHLMQACNLYALCIGAVEKVIAGALPEAARTSEQLQASLASIWIEASSRRSTDGVTWWSFIDKMPTTPLAPNGKHSTTAKPIQKEKYEDPLDEHPMNPINQEVPF